MEIVLPVHFVKKSQKAKQVDNDLMPVNNFFVVGSLTLISNVILTILESYQLIRHFQFMITQMRSSNIYQKIL